MNTQDTQQQVKKRSLLLGIMGAILWAGLTLAALWLGGFMTFMIYVRSLTPAPVTLSTDAIIVLTGGANRVNTGLDLLAAQAAERLFISGVDTRVTEQKILSLWTGDAAAMEEKIACCIILGHQAQNTTQNAHEARAWVKGEDIGSVRLVTSAYHVPRSYLEFRHALPDIAIALHPVDAGESASDKKWFWITAFEEYNKTLLALMRLYFYVPDFNARTLNGPEYAERSK